MLSKQRLYQIKKEVLSEGDEITSIFAALSDKGRFKMFKMLLKYDDLCVTEVANVFGISVPAASQQLKIMETSGLVKRERVGQMICYSINKSSLIVKKLHKMISLK